MNISPLQSVFVNIASMYCSDNNKILFSWKEIDLAYSQKHRYYHNLTHLSTLLTELAAVKHLIDDYHAILFSVFYHDVVYSVTSKQNEEKSAEAAKLYLTELGVDDKVIHTCRQHILATAHHNVSDHGDTNYFTDADICILGQPWEEYLIYTKQVRKEYAIYPDFIYKPGRKKALQHFLAMPAIYKTDYFLARYEQQARGNIMQELSILSC